jgi:hypothetical protein
MALANVFRRWLSLLGRRAHRRDAAALRVDWRVFGSGVHHVSTTGDLAPGGAFVHTPDAKPAGSPIVLDVETPRGERVTMHARVAWSGLRGMGLRFTRAWSR